VPAEAYALVATFAALSVVIGIAVTWVIGPRRRAAFVLPVAAAFGAFYLVGHRLGWSFGPEIELYGFQVAIVSDLVFALVAATAVALLQRAVVGTAARGAAGR
jgi:hypothetical protein